MRLPTWLRTRSMRRTGPRAVTVTLTADTTAYAAAINEAREATSRLRYRIALARERRQGREYVDELLDQMARDAGVSRGGHCGQPVDRQCTSNRACPCAAAVRTDPPLPDPAPEEPTP